METGKIGSKQNPVNMVAEAQLLWCFWPEIRLRFPVGGLAHRREAKALFYYSTVLNRFVLLLLNGALFQANISY